MSNLDFNTAETQQETIPDNETCHVRLTFVYGDFGGAQGNELHRSKNSDSLMLRLEATVTEGRFQKRKFWPGYFMGTTSGQLTEGQQTAVGISRKMLRAIVEASKGVAPTDETPAAIKARQLASLSDLDGMEFWCVVGIEKGRDGYDDKNVIKRVIPAGKQPGKEKPYDVKAEAAATRKSAQQSW